MTNKIIPIDNFFTLKDQLFFQEEYEKNNWSLKGSSTDVSPQKFWYKDLINTPLLNLFYNNIEKGINKKIKIQLLYANGQSHSQSGFWHTDAGSINHFTLVYFPKQWLPEYGGHLMIKDETVVSILPEFNKGVIFESTLLHMGLEPSKHCYDFRESIACKFEVVND